MSPASFSLKNKKVWIAGHRGIVGSALCRKITEEGISELVFEDRENLDLTQSRAVAKWVSHVKPDVVIVAAAKVGGIHANNTYPADFIYQNLMIACNGGVNSYFEILF